MRKISENMSQIREGVIMREGKRREGDRERDKPNLYKAWFQSADLYVMSLTC